MSRKYPDRNRWKSTTQLDNLHYFYSVKGLPLDLIADLLNMPRSRIVNKARRMKLRRPFLFTEPETAEGGRPDGSASHMDTA